MISATVTGNLGDDCAVRQAGDTSVVGFSIASNAREKVDGEWKAVPTWVRVSYFGKRAEAVAGYLLKGKTVAVRGTLTLREFEHKGEKRASLEMRADDVELLGSASGEDRQQRTARPSSKPVGPAEFSAEGFARDDDDIAF